MGSTFAWVGMDHEGTHVYLFSGGHIEHIHYILTMVSVLFYGGHFGFEHVHMCCAYIIEGLSIDD